MNLIEQYRKAHPERTVWSPEKGWHDSDEMIRWEGEGGRPVDEQSDRQYSPLLDVVQHFASQGVV